VLGPFKVGNNPTQLRLAIWTSTVHLISWYPTASATTRQRFWAGRRFPCLIPEFPSPTQLRSMPPAFRTAPASTQQGRLQCHCSIKTHYKDKGDPIGNMIDRNEEKQFASQDPLSSPDPANSAETPSRRELIERYGKYAIVAAPLLMFVSKAHAIHSRP